MKNEDWERWNPKIREGLIGLQVKDDTCAREAGTRSHPAPISGARSPAGSI